MATVNQYPEMLPLPGGMPPATYAPPQLEVGEEQSAISAAEIWRIIKQRKLMITLLFILFYVLVGVLTFVMWRFFPSYTAEAFMQLSAPQGPNQISQELVPPEQMQLLLETESQKIKQPLVYQEVVKKPEFQSFAFFNYYDNAAECMDDLDRLVSVNVVPNTQLIRVSLAAQKKAEAVWIVNELVNVYLAKFGDTDRNVAQTTLDKFKKQKDDLDAALKRQQTQMNDFRRTADIPAVPTAGSVQIANILELTNNLALLRAEEARLDLQLQTLRGVSSPELLPLTAEDRMIIESDPQLRFFRQQVELLEVQTQAILNAGRVGQNHREIKQLNAQRDEFFNKEILRREELVDDLRQRQFDMLQTQLQQMRAQIAQFEEERAAAEAKQQDIDEAIIQYQDMVKEEERLQLRLIDTEKLLDEAQAAKGSTDNQKRLVVWQRPEEPVWPSQPNLLLFLGGGAVLSLLGAVGLALLRDLTDTAIRTPLDVRREAKMSVLGQIPLIDDEEADIEEIEHATRQAPQSLVAEAFRHVRAQLTFSGPTESQRVMLVASPGPEDGATACAINLAVTFSQNNQRVLLIDCNFRKPRLRAAFRNTRSEGLSNVLIGQKKLADVIAHTELANLDVVTTGPNPPTPAELLGSTYMADLIKEAAQSYDRIILDGPPILLVSDSLVLATLVDGVIVVARAVANKKGELRRARDQLLHVGGRVLGCILNGVQKRAGGYLKQQYREFYDYTSDEALPQELLGGPTDSGDGKKASTTEDDDDGK